MKRNMKQFAAGLLAAAMLAATLPVSAFAAETAPEAPAKAAPATAETATEATAEEPSTMALGEATTEPYIIFLGRDGGDDIEAPTKASASEIKTWEKLPSPTHTLSASYLFAGWYTKPNGEGEQLTLEKAKANEGQLAVYAKWMTGERTVRTEPLDCTDTESVKTDMESAAQGWAWNKASKTLTLDNATFYVADASFGGSNYPDPAITVPDGTTIVVKPGTASWVHAAAEAIYVAGSVTIQGGATGTLALEGGVYPLEAFDGLHAARDLTVDGALLSVEGANAGVSTGGDMSLQNGAVVSAFGEGIGVKCEKNITATESRLIGGVMAVLESDPEPDLPPQPEPDEEGTGVGVYAEGTLTLQGNSAVNGYGDACAIGAVGCIFAETGFASDATTNTENFVSGVTKLLKQVDSKKPAVLRQESRTLYYYPEYGKLYDGLKSEGAREITELNGWQTEKNAAGTYDLLLEDFEFTTMADTALSIVSAHTATGNCTIKLSGENSLDAFAADGTAKDCTALETAYDLTILNNNDPNAKLNLTAWGVDGSSVTDPEADILSCGLNVAGKLTVTDVALNLVSGEVVGPKIEGAEIESVGILAGDDTTMTNVKLAISSSEVTDHGDIGMNCVNRGIEAFGSLTLNNCQAEIYPGKAGRSEGIYDYNEAPGDATLKPHSLTVNGGKLTVYIDSATVHSVGLAFYNVKVAGGADVKVLAGEARDLSHGVFTRNLTVDNATLYAYGSMGGIRVGNSCTLTGVTAKGSVIDEGTPVQAAKWTKDETQRSNMFTLVSTGETCNEVLIDATAPVPNPTATPAPVPTAAPTAVPTVVPTAAPAAAGNAATSFTVNAWVTAGGTVSPIGTSTYKQGASATYTITSAAGYRIVKVVVDGVDVGAVSSYTFTAINRSHELGVYFDKTTATVKSGTIPQTGDEAPLALYAALMAAAAAGIAGCTALRRRKSK